MSQFRKTTWTVKTTLRGREYVAVLGFGPDKALRVEAVATEYNRRAGLARRGSTNITRWLAPYGKTWAEVEALVLAKPITSE